MSVLDEAALDAGCARGDADAIRQVLPLLDHAQAYTRGRAAEMLAIAPWSALAPFAHVVFAATPSSLWWFVLAHRAEASRAPFGRLAEAPEDPAFVAMLGQRLGDIGAQDADTWFAVARIAPSLPATLREVLTPQLVLHVDDEVAVVAAMGLERPLTPEECARLARIEGRYRTDALVARVQGGDRTAWAALAARVLHAGPLAFMALEALEALPEGADVSALRSIWDRRWFVQPTHVRAADVALRLGDASARSRLEEWTESRKPAVRATAFAALLTHASADEHRDWVGRLTSAGASVVADVLETLRTLPTRQGGADLIVLLEQRLSSLR